MKVCQPQSNYFVFKEAVVYKRQACADLRTLCMNRFKWVRQEVRTIWEFFLLYLSLLKVTPETERI